MPVVGAVRLPGTLVSMQETACHSLLLVRVLPTRRCSLRVGRPQGGRGADSRQRWAVEAGFRGSSRPPYVFSDLLRLLGPSDRLSLHKDTHQAQQGKTQEQGPETPTCRLVTLSPS